IVVNISWGSQSGPHDGSSLVNQAFDALAGNGKIIVMSAGNDGEDKIHMAKTFTPADTVVNTFLTFSAPGYKRTWIDIWGDTAEKFCVKTSLFSKGIEGSTTNEICIDNGITYDTLISANGLDTCFVETITSDAEYNLKPRVTISVYNKAKDSVGLSVTGKSGSIDMWNEYYYYGYTYGFSSEFADLGIPGATGGNTATTISDMGAGEKTLLVAAFTTKTTFKNILGGTLAVSSGYVRDSIALFSSHGPYVDGRIKPDIAAPGMVVLSSMNSHNPAYTAAGSQRFYLTHKYTDAPSGKDFYYGVFSGTSAASPMAAGVVALLLQRDPTLSPERVKEILFATAIKDKYTGALPAAGNNIWGHGKINAYQAIRQLLTELSVITYTGKEKLDCVLFPNPNEGNFTLDYLAAHNDQLLVSVSDMSGRILSSQDWKVNSGQNMLPLNLSSYAKGIYFVKVEGKEGSASIKTVLQ
ncbi:MAG TPA: S8/S53 family peptidase, partial [Chitinophagaceae bacterium]|nr:S8/S53 family peptidase [Chitinophagaceae bacterium]